MNYLSICSGIEAATQAWHPLGWQPLAFAEIEPFPAAVLAHRHPSVPNLGDFTRYDEWPLQTLLDTDLLVGGTPCQAFSVAGLRKSLTDDRGNLTLTCVKLYDLITSLRHAAGRPAPFLVWENVPGVLNTPDNAFGCFLAALAGEDDPLLPPGGRWKNAGYVRGPSRAIAWRILDAQYFGLAQRRRRVFLVAGPRDNFHPEQVLFESTGLRRDTPPRRETWQSTAPTLAARTKGGSGLGTAAECDGALIPQIANVLTRRMSKGLNSTLDEGQTPIVEINNVNPVNQVNAVPLIPEAIAFSIHENQRAESTLNDTIGTLKCNGGKPGQGYPAVMLEVSESPSLREASPSLPNYAVRRLTPRECERLQGFPDDHTQIPWRGKPAEECPDGPRYKSLGNSMAVTVMHWIGQRLQAHLPKV